MVELKFLDVKTKKTFTTSDFKIGTTKNGRKMATTTAPSGVKAVRFVKSDFEE